MARVLSDQQQAIRFVTSILTALVRQGQRALDVRENRHQVGFTAIMSWLEEHQPQHPAHRWFIPLPVIGIYSDFDTILIRHLQRDYITEVMANGTAVRLLQNEDEADHYWETLSETDRTLFDTLAKIFREANITPVT